MLKIFMTGDNHIGLKYARHEQSAQLSIARITAFEDMVKCANAELCDLFVITGDLFENTYSISKKDVKALLDILVDFKGTVIILPGNHDYYDRETKLWQYFDDITKNTDNILLLSEYRKYELNINDETVVLYPALCTSLHSEMGENNLQWIKEENIEPDNVYRIGIAHGAVEGETIDNEGRYFLMTRDELENIKVDAWLIGHTHVPFPANLQENLCTCPERIFNAGTHVQTDVLCNTDGVCFILEIEGGNGQKNICAKKIISGNLRFIRKNISVSAGEMKNILMREFSDYPDNAVIDVVLSGAVSVEEYENRTEILKSIFDRFIEWTYNDYSLSKLISKELIEKEFPETSFSAGFLMELLDNPKEAQLAYELLKSVKEGK